MTQLETNLNFISSLPDDPTGTTAELKQEFDKAGNVIKNFINNTLESEITADIASCLASAKAYADSAIGELSFSASNISYDNTLSGMTATDVQSAIDELKTGLTSVASAANSKLKYSDFAFTSTTINISLSAAARKSGTQSISKSGYYALGIIGDTSTSEAIDIRQKQITSRSNGSGVITYLVQNEDYGNPRTGKITFDILWVKIS